jgi:hypothetical protein
MSNPTTITHIFETGRDKYGRNCHYLRTYPGFRTQGVTFKLPKGAQELRTDGNKYLVNNWNKQGDAAISYHRTLAAAKAHLLAEVA